MMTVRYRTVDVDGLPIFYRSAGPADAPAILLLHGFPTSSHMFRNFMPLLADRFRLIAPDLPGFGRSAQPDRSGFAYTFDHLAHMVGRFTEVMRLERFALYIFDYGAPVGLRLASAHPERISAIISQNGNAYVEGLGEAFDPVRAYWADPSPARRDALRVLLQPETTWFQYQHGVDDPSLISPDGPGLDNHYLSRPGNEDLQLDLMLDYRSNISAYPSFQAYLRTHQPPLLAIWGRRDPFFRPEGAEAFLRDVPNATVRFLETGHFALETHAQEIAHEVSTFLSRHV
ncbi:alpha/beta fold hydrolase [Microvirga sp. VF16]|uniref:alpha/beta fold hydrolase n=1 Tax=Microvirga sp. VF16 TaxID=2807101 RepID=UPI00193D9BD2|nr:alpha/beta hydrolase [Microvirga sp. VF16]QRM31925.1 alpha/beta hydrolase [Microvirga sp. VF16]